MKESRSSIPYQKRLIISLNSFGRSTRVSVCNTPSRNNWSVFERGSIKHSFSSSSEKTDSILSSLRSRVPRWIAVLQGGYIVAYTVDTVVTVIADDLKSTNVYCTTSCNQPSSTLINNRVDYNIDTCSLLLIPLIELLIVSS